MSSVYAIDTESRWFPIVVLIISALIAIFCGFNVYYYNQIRLNDSCTGAVTVEQATTMFWINLVVVILAIVIFLWSIWRIIFSEKYRSGIKEKVVEVLEAPSGIIQKTSSIQVPVVSKVPVVSQVPAVSTTSYAPISSSISPISSVSKMGQGNVPVEFAAGSQNYVPSSVTSGVKASNTYLLPQQTQQSYVNNMERPKFSIRSGMF